MLTPFLIIHVVYQKSLRTLILNLGLPVFAIVLAVIFPVVTAVVLAIVALLAIHIDLVQNTAKDPAAGLDQLILDRLCKPVADGAHREYQNGSITFFTNDSRINDARL